MEDRCAQCGLILSKDDVVSEVNCRVPDSPKLIAKAKETAAILGLENLQIQSFEGYLPQTYLFCSYYCLALWALKRYKEGERLAALLAQLEG